MTAPFELVPCTQCDRHVRVTESACPFCDAPRPLEAAPQPSLPTGRLGSLATLTFRAAAIGALLTACSAESSDDDGGAGAAGKRQQAGGAAGTQGDDGAGASNGGRSGATFGGAPSFAGAPPDGSGVPIYRATPKG